MEKLKILALALILPLVVAGCKNQNKKIDKGFVFDQAQVEGDIRNTKSIIYLFPAPGEILSRFYDADLEYHAEMMHDPGRASSYITSRDKGLNLGVYISDLAYSALFARNNKSTDYLEAVRMLSDELDISNAAFESLGERLRDNIGNNDSLVAIGNDAFFIVLDFLENSGRDNTIALITSGAYIEALYLAMMSIEEYNENDPVLQQISELKYPLENLLKQSESVSDDPAVEGILDYTRELNEIFSALQAESVDVSLEETGVITLSGGSIPDITAENFSAIKRNVLSTRAFIVGE
jgi:hypothetical protein